jgi:uncharacterized membrane protein
MSQRERSASSENSPPKHGFPDAEPFQEIIPPEAAAELRKAGIEIDTIEKAEAVRAAMMLSISRSPLPSPEMLKEYDDYKPGMGGEVVEWVKDQTRHRQTQEKLITSGNETRLNTAQSNAFIVALIGIAAAGTVSIWNTWAAISIAVVAVGGPSATSVFARFMDRVRGDP